MMENRSASLLDWLISRHQEDSMPPLRYWRVAHAGWTMLYLYRENGADYLMEYSPYMNQGYGAYSIRIFYIGPDKKTVEAHSHTADFALQQEDRTGFFGDPDALAAFMDTAEGYIKSSLLLVSTGIQHPGTSGYPEP